MKIMLALRKQLECRGIINLPELVDVEDHIKELEAANWKLEKKIDCDREDDRYFNALEKAKEQLDAVRGLHEQSCAGKDSEYTHGYVDGWMVGRIAGKESKPE